MRNRILTILAVFFVVGLVLYFLGFKMERADLHVSAASEPLICIGGEVQGEFCSAGTLVPITNSLLMTLLVDLALVLTIVFGARNMKLIPTGFQNLIEAVVEGVYNFARGVDPRNIAKFFALPATIFFFFLYANLFALVPGVGSIGNCTPKAETAAEAAPAKAAATSNAPINTKTWPLNCGEKETLIPYLRAPAADLNITLAFALVAMFMVEFFGFQALGFGYLTKFFNFKEGPLGVFLGLIELISEFSRIISFAFRIYGNIFGGEVILLVMAYLFPILLPLTFYGFELFVALLQAVIFSILTLVFFSIAIIGHGGEDHGTVQTEADTGPVAVHAH